MKLLICIPHYNKDSNSERLLERCLASINKFENILLYHTIIIDDASPREITPFARNLSERYPVKIFKKDKNTSYSDVINLGLEYADGNGYDVMLTLNNDVELLTPIFRQTVRFFVGIPDLLVMGGVLLYPTGKIQSAGFTLENTEEEFGFREFEKNCYYGKDTPAAFATRFVDGVTGAMQFIKVKPAIDIGGYSTKFKMSYEDVEFCLRAWEKNYKVLFNPEIKAIHSESSTRGTNIGPRELESLQQVIKLINKLDTAKLKHQVREANSFYKSQGLKAD